MSLDEELFIDMVLSYLPLSYDQFVLTHHLNNTETTLTQLYNLLQTVKSGIKKNHAPTAINAHFLAIGSGKMKKRKAPYQSTRKGKAHDVGSSSGSKTKPNFDVPATSDPKEATSFHCGEKGHWRISCPKYLHIEG